MDVRNLFRAVEWVGLICDSVTMAQREVMKSQTEMEVSSTLLDS